MEKDQVAILLGQRLREIRLKNCYTIEDLAIMSGIDYTQISRIELGKINTSMYQIYKIAKTLNISITDVVEVLN